jgi:hypothetical protein
VSNERICGQIILYGEEDAGISMAAPQRYAAMQHLTPKRMIPDAALAFSYYVIAPASADQER